MFEQALIEALNRCRREGVKPTAINAYTRLDEKFDYYSFRSVVYKLDEMVKKGMVEKPSKRGGYLPKMIRLEFCPTCKQPLPVQLHLPFSIAN